MTKTPYLFILLVLAIMSPALAAATGPGDTMTFDSIQLTRIVPEQAATGERIVISQVLVNTGTSSKTVGIIQVLSPDADFDPALLTTTVVSHTGEGRVCFGAKLQQPASRFIFRVYNNSKFLPLGHHAGARGEKGDQLLAGPP